ncbi:hypothetical protein D3C74_316740 [compost metagenome]
MGRTVDRRLPLLHALQEGRLRLGRRTVDLVADHDVGEDGSGAKLEVVRLRPVDVDAREVAREQVWRELDASDVAVDGACERLGERRLADSGHVLEQEVALREEHRDREVDELRSSGDHRLDPGADPTGRLDELAERIEAVTGRGRGVVGEHEKPPLATLGVRTRKPS